MLATFRSATFIKVMMLIVAGSFIALIVLEWGADFSTTGRSRTNVVGVINGMEISYEQFDQALRDAYRLEKDRGNENPELSTLVQQQWDQLVTQIILAQQIDKYQIRVSDQEVDFVNRNNPAPDIRGIEYFHTDGAFDPSKYQQFLDSPGTYADPNNKRIVLIAENRAREQLLTAKLQDLVAGSIQVTTPELKSAYHETGDRVKVEYAGLEAGRIPDSLVAVDDADIRAFYDARVDDFHQEEAVKASFVAFPKIPDQHDEAYAHGEIRRVRDEVVEGADFAKLAAEVSEDPGSAQRGGDLGFFRRGQMVPTFEDSAFSLSPGQVSQPFRTQFGWHILKVEGRRGAADSLEASARHILVRVQPGRDTLDSLRLAAEEFLERARDAGFEAAAREKGLEASDAGFITAGGFFPLLGGKTSGLVRSFLDQGSGALSSTYETERGIYIFCLTGKREAGPRPLDEVKNQIAGRLRQERKVALARSRMEAILSSVRGGAPLEAAARAQGVRYSVTDPFSKADFVPIVGSRNAFVGQAFRLPAGALSDVVVTQNGAYVLKVLEKTPAPEAGFDARKDDIAGQVISQKRNDLLAAWFSDLRESARIEDYRHHFYSEF